MDEKQTQKKSRLSEAARQHKKEYQKLYEERTGRAAQKRYQEQHKHERKKILLNYHREKDSVILQQLELVSNKSDYIRQLILADIEKQSEDDK